MLARASAGSRPRPARPPPGRGRRPARRPSTRRIAARQLGRRRVLEQEARPRRPPSPAAGSPGRPNVVRMRTRVPGSSARSAPAASRPVGARHLDVEQRDVGPRGARGVEHLVAAPDLRRRPRCRPRARAGSRAPRAPSSGPRRAGRGSRRPPGTLTRRRKPPSGAGAGVDLAAEALAPARAARPGRGRRRGRPPLAPRAVVDDLGARAPPGRARCGSTRARAAVADHVRRPLAHRPGEHRLDLGRERDAPASRARPRSRRPRAPSARPPARPRASAGGSR